MWICRNKTIMGGGPTVGTVASRRLTALTNCSLGNVYRSNTIRRSGRSDGITTGNSRMPPIAGSPEEQRLGAGCKNALPRTPWPRRRRPPARCVAQPEEVRRKGSLDHSCPSRRCSCTLWGTSISVPGPMWHHRLRALSLSVPHGGRSSMRPRGGCVSVLRKACVCWKRHWQRERSPLQT